MKVLQFNGTSAFSQFVFKHLLNILECSFRYRLNNPKTLVRAAGVQAGQAVLEVGCGSGFFTPALSDIVGEQGLVHSIDLQPIAVEATRQKMQALGKQNVRTSSVDAQATGLPDGSFDTIIIYGVIPAPFISEKRLGLEMYRLLKPGGILAVWTAVPFWSPRTLLEAASFRLGEQQQGVHRLQKVAA